MIHNIGMHAAASGPGVLLAVFICAIRCDYLTRLDPIIRRCDDFDYIPMICDAMIENTASVCMQQKTWSVFVGKKKTEGLGTQRHLSRFRGRKSQVEKAEWMATNTKDAIL